MRIANPNQTPVPSSETNADSASAARTSAAPPSASTSAPTPAVSVQAFSMVPSFELLSLTATLKQIPPVRQEVLAETIRRLAAGDFRSADTLEKTAAAILGA